MSHVHKNKVNEYFNLNLCLSPAVGAVKHHVSANYNKTQSTETDEDGGATNCNNNLGVNKGLSAV